MRLNPSSFLVLTLLCSCGSSTGGNDAMTPSDAMDTLDAADAPSPSDASHPVARGLFVPVSLSATGTMDAMRALALPDIDGIAVDILWTDIAATAPRTYDFTRLDAMLLLARNAHKGVELSVIAAGGTPSWFDPATLIHLQYTPHSGNTTRCYDTITPPLWNSDYLSAWDDMTAQLAAHLDSAGFMDSVVALRLTGLNASTAELHLPTQAPSTLMHVPACYSDVDNVMVWLSAQYTPSLMEMAWASMVHSWATHFPTALFEFVTWGESQRFPPINDNSMQIPVSAATDQAEYDTVMAEAASQLGSRLIVGHWFLMTDLPADSVTVGYANHYGIGTMWQTNLWWTAYENQMHGTTPGAAACGGTLLSPVQCTDTNFLNELNTGVQPAGLTLPLPAGATRIIEVFIPDPTLYPNATHTVHLALTQ